MDTQTTTQEATMKGNEDYAAFVAKIPKLGVKRTVERARAALASHILSRAFGEPVDAFKARSTRYQGLAQFIADHQA